MIFVRNEESDNLTLEETDIVLFSLEKVIIVLCFVLFYFPAEEILFLENQATLVLQLA